MKLRPVDLARAVGISTQQVRNYVEAGILPPAPRTPTGYRVFTERHRQALLTFRALVRGHGRHLAAEIMLAVNAGEVARALVLVDASHAALHGERQSLAETGAALAVVAESDPPAVSGGLRIGEVAHRLRVRTSALRVWESAGLLMPERERGTGYRVYRSGDVRDARMIHMLRQARYPLSQIRPVLDGLRETGSSVALRATIAAREADLADQAAAMLEAASHLYAYTSG